MQHTSALAHAKINLVLEVGARRPDGYHDIDTILQELVLADRVTVSWGRVEGVAVTGPFAEGTPTDATNLAWRAAEELAARTNQSLSGFGISLQKEIPAAGGLGGGAADAVAVLRLLQPAWNASDAHVTAAANAVGSDEAFFLVGGLARARGRGELVEALPALAPHGVVLFVPPTTLESKTARLFAALDALPVLPARAAAVFTRRAAGPLRQDELVNHFEQVARATFPGLAALWESLESALGERGHLAGAGPALFWIGPADDAAEVARRGRTVDCSVLATRTR